MNYEQFVQTMKECIEKKLHEHEKIERQEVLKNNGKKMIGLCIQKLGEEVVPIIYLEEFYKRYLRGESIECLSEEILTIRNSSSVPSRQEYDWMMDFQKTQSRIVYRLINFEKNQELLKGVPHLPMMDLAIIFCAVISKGKSEDYSLLIRNEHINLWRIPISVLYETARKNTALVCPAIFRPLSSYISLMGDMEDFGNPLWVLTNEQGIYGAATLLYPGILQKIYQQLKDSYYLLPSSVHEFLVLAEQHSASRSCLKRIVYEANVTVVEQSEFLSDNIYYFNGKNITKV